MKERPRVDPRPLESVMRTLKTSGLAKQVAQQIPKRPASSRGGSFAKKPNRFRNRSYAQNAQSAHVAQREASSSSSSSAPGGGGKLTQTLLHMSQYDYSNAVSNLKQSAGPTYHARTTHNPRCRTFSRGFLGVMYTDTSLDSATRGKAKEAAAKEQHAKGRSEGSEEGAGEHGLALCRCSSTKACAASHSSHSTHEPIPQPWRRSKSGTG